MIRFSDIEDAFFYVNSAPYGMNSAYINQDTGESFYRSLMWDSDQDDEIPNWERCIRIPHKNDLELGHDLVFEFVNTRMPADSEQVQRIFRKAGAYGRFKNLLASRGLLQAWYDFENQRQKQALLQWSRENDIELAEEPGITRGNRGSPRQTSAGNAMNQD